MLISTPKGKVFHSGDWKLEQSKNLSENIDFKSFRSIGSDGVLAMVCDSTNALVDGRTPSESFAYNGLLKEIKNKKI
jgi:ribonuclease J